MVLENPLGTDIRFYLDESAVNLYQKNPLFLWTLSVRSNRAQYFTSEESLLTISDLTVTVNFL